MDLLSTALADPRSQMPANALQVGQLLGQGISGGVGAYFDSANHSQELRQKAALLAAQLKQHDLEAQKAQRTLAGDSEAALREQGVSLYRAAKAGDEDAAKQLGGLLPKMGALHNQAHGLDLPVMGSPVGAPIFGAPKTPTAPVIPGGVVPPPSGLDGLSLDPTGVLSQSLGDSLPQETGRSFTTDKTLAYMKRGLLMPPGERIKVNPGDTIGEWDPIDEKPTNVYTAPNPQAEARLEALKAQIVYKESELDERHRHNMETEGTAAEIAKLRGELGQAQIEAKQGALDARYDLKDVQARQSWMKDRMEYVGKARNAFIQSHSKVTRNEDGGTVVTPPSAQDVEKAAKAADAEYQQMAPYPASTGQGSPPGAGGPTTIPKNPNPTRSLTNPGKPGGRNPFVSQAPDIQLGLTPQMQAAYNPGGALLPKAGGVAHWAPYVQAASQQTGVPEQILEAVMRQESGGRANARSPVGALGLMQLMPGTAAGLHVNPSDPAQNILGGAKYLRQMYDKFGNWSDAIAAYNAGPDDSEASKGKRIGPFARSHDDPRYRVWENPQNGGYAETRNYVQRIKADLRRMQKGGQFGALPAEMTDKMADFYAKHGIQPGAADA